MAAFEVKVQRIFVRPHPNADKLELANIGSPDGWQVVVGKGNYKTGDLVCYIGENAVVPEWVLKRFGYWNEEKGKGLLAGSKGDRVKAVKLRDEFSLGITIPLIANGMGGFVFLETGEPGSKVGFYVEEGQDVSEYLEVTKYEPPIPAQLAGEVFNASTLVGVNYDIEDIKNFPNVLQEGEEVQMTVKIHGTNCQVAWLDPNISDEVRAQVNIDEWIQVADDKDGFLYGYVAVASKGLGAQGLFFKDNEANANNVYLRAVRPHLLDIARHCFAVCKDHQAVVVVGEVFGKGIQDGFDYGQAQISLKAFDVYLGYRGKGKYIADRSLDCFCAITEVPRVPVVYRGPYSYAILDKLANDPETEFNCNHVREGVIVKPVEERRDPVLGRVALKHRSIAYMTRKGGTEYS